MSDIQFIDVDPELIMNEMITGAQQVFNEVLYPGDERRMLLQNLMPPLISIIYSINAIGKGNLLRYAQGIVLDALGERVDCARLPAQSAYVMLQFSLSAPQLVDILIPAVTRVTPDGKLYFAVVQDAVIPAGGTSCGVLAKSTAGGIADNGFAIGAIKNIVDPLPYVESVTNTNVPSGGVDAESDDNYRERIRQAPASFSTAGPADAYKYWAKTADANILDVEVTSPAACQIKIIVLMNNGGFPSQEVLTKVLETCSDRSRRPLTDQVTAVAPTAQVYDINFKYYITQDQVANASAINTAILAAVETYKSWQCSKLGRAISPDYLKKLLYTAGACKVDITSPVYTEISIDKVASLGTATVNNGGVLSWT